jgi:hypothetical protein
MSLWLEFERSKKRFQMRSQEGHSISLIRFPFQAKPNQMDVVRHQAVYWAKQSFACGCMKHCLTEPQMKLAIKPACSAVKNGQSPVNNGIALVKFRRQPWQVIGAWFASHYAKIFETRYLVSYFLDFPVDLFHLRHTFVSNKYASYRDQTQTARDPIERVICRGP